MNAELASVVKAAGKQLEEATRQLEDDRKSRRIQLLVEFAVLILVVVMLLIQAGESRQRDRDLAQQAKEDAIATCEAINTGRDDLRQILTFIVASGADRRDPESQERTEQLLQQVAEEFLQPLECPSRE